MPDPISRVVSQDVLRWDATLSSPLAQGISDVAQYGIVLAILIVGFGALWAAGGLPRERIVATVFRLLPGIVAVGIALLVAQILGVLLPETRPFVALGGQPLFPHAADASFPSDHVSGGMAMLAARTGRGTKVLTVIVVTLVGIARVLAGVHWLDDIVGAAILGLVVAGVVVLASSPMFFRRMQAGAA